MSAPDPTLLSHIQAAVLAQIDRDDIVLPVLPHAVVRALEMLRDPDFDLNLLVRVIEPDPVIAAQVLKLANSAVHGGRPPVASLPAALMRVGGATLGSFLIEISARKVFASSDPAINQACRKLWEHAVASAVVAREVFQHVRLPGGDETAEAAYLAGLLHDIGKPILAGLLLDAELRLRGRRTRGWLSPDQWVEVVSTTHRRVGVTLVRRWQLPLPIEEAVRASFLLDPEVPRSMSNAVALGNAVAKREGLYIGHVDAVAVSEQVAEGIRLLGVDASWLDGLSKELPRRVAERLS